MADSEHHAQLLEDLLEVINVCMKEGIIEPFCGRHEGIPITDAEAYDDEHHGIDRCLPAFRVLMSGAYESVVEEEVEIEVEEMPSHLEQNIVYLPMWTSKN